MWMELKNIMLKEISQTKKDEYFSLIYASISKFSLCVYTGA